VLGWAKLAAALVSPWHPNASAALVISCRSRWAPSKNLFVWHTGFWASRPYGCTKKQLFLIANLVILTTAAVGSRPPLKPLNSSHSSAQGPTISAQSRAYHPTAGC
jgi:hypothetical protein